MDKQTTIDLFGEIDSDFGNDKTTEISIDELLLNDYDDGNLFEDITLNTADFKMSDADLEINDEGNGKNLEFSFDTNGDLDADSLEMDVIGEIDEAIKEIGEAIVVIDDVEIVDELCGELVELETIQGELVNEVLDHTVENIVTTDEIIIEDIIDDEEAITVDPVVREKLIDTTKLNTNLGNFNIVDNHESDEIQIKVEEEISLGHKDEFGQVNIMVIGIGGCGCNIINRMFSQKNSQIKLIAMDTSEQTLENISSDYKLLIGENEFMGHGSGGDTTLCERAFDFSKPKIQSLLQGVDMVFLAGGIGRGTGSVGLIKVGKIAKEMGILTIGFATLPRKIEANVPILEKFYPLVCDAVDSTVIVENERVGQNTKHLPITGAMAVADAMLIDGIKGVFELVTKPGKINLDYADIKTAFSDQGSSVMGIGFGKGENSVVKAIENAFHSEVTDFDSIRTAKTIIFNITCAPQTITIDDATKGTERLYSYGSGQNMNHLLFGYSYDESLEDEVKVTFIATGTTPAEYNFSESLISSAVVPVKEKTLTKSSFTETEIFGNSKPSIKSSESRSFPDFFKK